MEPSKSQLAASFAEMEDHVLLNAAARRMELTDLARETLAAEVQRRELELPPIEETTDLPDEEYIEGVWVTIDRFRDLSAAIVARSALEAAGVRCFLRDENTVRLDWQVSNFIGGMRLQVLQQDEAAAVEVLRDLTLADDAEVAEGEDALQSDYCPKCGSANVSRAARRRGIALASMVFFGLPLPRGRKTWKCEVCGTEWDDQE